MSTASHIAGPWIAYLYGKDSYGRTIATVGANDGDNRICELCAVDLPVDSIEANARLIAAAPDMHHALYLALGCLKCHMFDCQREGLAAAAASAERAVNATLAAIAKAEGVK